jgi:hypothetical protein
MGSAAVMGLATGAMAYATGGASLLAKGGGKATLEKLGRTRAGQATKEWVQNKRAETAERFGLAGVGHAASQKNTRAATAAKQVEALRTSSAEGDKERYKQLVSTGKGAMGAAAVNIANEKGDLNKILNPSNTAAGLNTVNQRVATAIPFGYERKTFEAKNHELAGLDEPKVTKELGVMGLTDTAPHRARAQSSVNRKQLEKNWSDMKIDERADVPLSRLHSDDAKDFVLSRTGSDLDAFRTLPSGHVNRTIVKNMVGANINSDQASLDITKHIDAALDRAYDANDTNLQRKLKELRTKAHTL